MVLVYNDVLDSTYFRYKRFAPAFFFLVGFVFDIFTLERIDSLPSLVSQVVYLALVSWIIVLEMWEGEGVYRASGTFEKVWKFRKLGSHFFLGSLLSNYMLFYFKSASIFSSSVFLVLLAVLMILNESPRFQENGPVLRLTLLSLCLLSYFVYLLPILVGFIGVLPFLLALGVSALLLFGLYCIYIGRISEPRSHGRRFRIPILLVLLIFAVLYFFRLIPPVPLSASYLGVYHGVKKEGDHYRLIRTRPRWKFWQHGDQSFSYREGDQLVGYARVFSPSRFKDQIQVRWLLHEGKRGWQTQDVIPIEIVGGRENGYRGYTVKKNFQTGRWRFQVETTDDREIGRLYFNVFTEDSFLKRQEVEDVD